jgi:glycosyltransferase involved in cell wall biosynthesis
MSKRSLLFIVPSLNGGGAERTLINLLQKIDYSNYKIDLISILNKGPYLKQIPSDVRLYTALNNEFFYKFLSFLHRKFKLPIVFKYFLPKSLQNKKYDIAISYLDSNFTDLLFFQKGAKKRYAWVHASYKSHRNFGKYYKSKKRRDYLIKQRYGRLDGIVFVSNEAKKEFIETFGDFKNTRVVYNLINRKEVLKKSEALEYKNDRFCFVAAGSLLPVKGFDRLIRATRLVFDQEKNFKVIILGKGPEQAKLLKLIRDLGLENVVELMGFQENPYPLIRHSDVFVMSSISEALPTVLCEAMILGKPTLVTNCSGCREIVDSGQYGLMVEQDDTSLAEKMLNYLENPPLIAYYKTKSLERAQLFDDKLILKQHYEIFDL